eukprot:TRINITY_DN70321_c0_g1_i1.p1 TRINITY_DN70321_c0_g1~~TRINITY_DN70321_c0_g1_i1.p1  ORF type:complete len:159 (+),score=12.21 TRINITY_DN70321_c0_g1_i1:66-479(+)
MPRDRSDSRSPPRKSRKDSRSRSRGRKGGGSSGGTKMSEWGSSGVIVDLKTSGFGFIRPDTGKVDDKDLFFHSTAVDRGTVFDDLQVDDEVTYEAVLDERKNQATAKKVSLVSGGGRSKKSRRKDDSRSPSRSRRRR